MTSPLPTATQLQGMADLPAIVQWAGLTVDSWNAFSATMGAIPDIRIMAAIPATVMSQGLRAVRITPTDPDAQARELTPVEVVQVALVWRVARQHAGMPDVDLLVPAQQPQQAQTSPHTTTSSSRRKVKASTVLDQADESEIQQLSTTQVDQFFNNHKDVTGAFPLEEAEPTEDQISAANERVIERDESPYADFSVLTPFGRRTAKALRLRSWVLQPDGSYRSVEIPGPPTWEAWYACYLVYRAILFMLRYPASALRTAETRVVSQSSLEIYYEAFRKLVGEYPECWHLCTQAEDRCRGEAFPRYRRILMQCHQTGSVPVGISFNPLMPWDGVFQYAANDDRFWDKEVRRPATAFLARGKIPPQMSATQGTMDAVENVEDGVEMSASGIRPRGSISAAASRGTITPSPGQGISKHARQKRKLQGELEQSKLRQRTVPDSSSGGHRYSGSQQWDQSKKDYNGSFTLDREGNQVCFKFAKGKAGDCPDPCPSGRAHACQVCLGPHPNSECPKGKGNNSSKGGGKGKGKRKGK